jgi:hypothetical protein
MKRKRPIRRIIHWIESGDGQIAVTDMSVDDLFLLIQPDEAARLQAKNWIDKEKNLCSTENR